VEQGYRPTKGAATILRPMLWRLATTPIFAAMYSEENGGLTSRRGDPFARLAADRRQAAHRAENRAYLASDLSTTLAIHHSFPLISAPNSGDLARICVQATRDWLD
jgi:hypothetical protein